MKSLPTGRPFRGVCWKSLREKAATFPDTAVADFIVENNRVVGVLIEQKGQRGVLANDGVLVNAGGFSRNQATRLILVAHGLDYVKIPGITQNAVIGEDSCTLALLFDEDADHTVILDDEIGRPPCRKIGSFSLTRRLPISSSRITVCRRPHRTEGPTCKSPRQ